MSVYIQVLSLLPDPDVNPYFRNFLRSSCALGLPELIARHLIQGINWISPSGPGHVCILVTNLLIWYDVGPGCGDKVPIDPGTRAKLATALRNIQSAKGTTDYPAKITDLARDRLAIILKLLEGSPADSLCARDYLLSIRQRLEKGIPDLHGCLVCKVNAELLCSQCGWARFCNKLCQAKAWENGHQLECFTAD